MTLQGNQTYCSQLTSQSPKTVKSHLSLTLMRVKLVHLFHQLIGYLEQIKRSIFLEIFFLQNNNIILIFFLQNNNIHSSFQPKMLRLLIYHP